MDDVDKAFTDSIVPEGAMVTSLLSIVGWVDKDGKPDWRLYVTGNETLAMHVGMLELSKDKLREIAARG